MLYLLGLKNEDRTRFEMIIICNRDIIHLPIINDGKQLCSNNAPIYINMSIHFEASIHNPFGNSTNNFTVNSNERNKLFCIISTAP